MKDDQEKVKLRSYILEFFPFEAILDFYKLTMELGITNNEKRDEMIGILNKYNIPHEPIGPGTNRYTALIDGYIMKFCLDTDGMIDNLREFKYSMVLQPYVLKVYECLPDGLIMVCEYVEIMTEDRFTNSEIRQRMLTMLEDISNQYFIGDIGLDIKNIKNWGFRKNINRDLVILDFAYCYALSFKAFKCDCSPGAILYYNEKYTHLICPKCGKTYSFSDIRRRISREDQKKEIGDIRKIGYVISNPVEVQVLDPELSWREEPVDTFGTKKKKKKLFDSLKDDMIDYSEVEEEEEDVDEVDEDQMWDNIRDNYPF